MTELLAPSVQRVRTLLADDDPISRDIVQLALRSDERLHLVAGIDSRRPLSEWPLGQVEVVVLGLSHGDVLLSTLRDLAARGIKSVVVGLDWSRRVLDNVLAAGASGCLVKDARLDGVVSGVRAVAAGNRVLSPCLLELYAPRHARDGRVDDLVARLTLREREILNLIGEGLSTSEVAAACGVSSATIKSHVSHALTKLRARSRLEAVLMLKRQ
ncbi:LuxR C-terminal-related transcriptional regulator [Streptomyces sp. NPDC014734]|uniref:LuxR C-terminal-related transcriptional regulator n=1 Tax=Streptomyces sp. NPDC014734 TaxID=3364886 RepID=UPI0036F53ECF